MFVYAYITFIRFPFIFLSFILSFLFAMSFIFYLVFSFLRFILSYVLFFYLFIFIFCFSFFIFHCSHFFLFCFFHFLPFDLHYSSLFSFESSVNFTWTVHLIKNMNFSNSKTSSLEIRHRVVIFTTNLNCIFLHRKAKQEEIKNQWESRNYFHPMPMGLTFLFPNIGFHHCSAICTMIISVEKKKHETLFPWKEKRE